MPIVVESVMPLFFGLPILGSGPVGQRPDFSDRYFGYRMMSVFFMMAAPQLHVTCISFVRPVR